MEQKWLMQYPQRESQRSPVSSVHHMVLEIMECVEEHTAPECYTCGQVQKLQLWEDSRQQVY